ncbi:hypothetical protein, partial [Chromobacterium haemolyticum]|uniref:hypothetical protein n=1 Tax=Chromobacterium haemolyticum TaxID=394935 RepID=UPI001EE664A6
MSGFGFIHLLLSFGVLFSSRVIRLRMAVLTTSCLKVVVKHPDGEAYRAGAGDGVAGWIGGE